MSIEQETLPQPRRPHSESSDQVAESLVTQEGEATAEAESKKDRRRRHRFDWAWLSVPIAAAIAGISFFAINLYFNGGHYIPPLDDTYIHMQYGRQIGLGEFLRFQPGEPISTGASSVFYVFLIGALYGLGAHGSLLLPAAVLLGVGCHVLAALFTARLAHRLSGRVPGICAGLLVACSGPLLWSATSGMEVSVAAALLTGTLLVFLREAENQRFRWTPLLVGLCVLCRFEMAALAGTLALVMIVVAWRAPGLSRFRRVTRCLWYVVPFFFLAGQLVLYKWATGSVSPNGNQAKSLLSPPQFSWAEFAGGVAENMRQFVEILAGISRQDFVFPGAILVAVFGVAVLVHRPGVYRVFGIVLGAGLPLTLLAISTLSTALWQQVRYLHPFLPLVLVLIVVAAAELQNRLPGRGGSALGIGVLGTAGLFTLFALPGWAYTVGQDTSAIRQRVVSLAAWTAGNLPSNARIGVHDVGAAAYLGEQRTVDLIGLTTNGLARPAINGAGSLYEELRAMPAAERPDYFAIYDAMPGGVQLENLGDAGVFGELMIARPDMTVAKADWSWADTGDAPLQAPPGEVRDYLNVGSMDSERAHDHEVRSPVRGFQPMTDVATAETDSGPVVDSNRHVYGAESFTVHGLTPGRAATVTARSDASGPKPGVYSGARQVRVFVDGTYVGKHDLAAEPEGWDESSFSIPGELITDPDVEVELKSPQEYVGPYADYLSFGYWISQ